MHHLREHQAISAIGATRRALFRGATGSVSGVVNAAGGLATVKLAGPITLANLKAKAQQPSVTAHPPRAARHPRTHSDPMDRGAVLAYGGRPLGRARAGDHRRHVERPNLEYHRGP
jgi:hypothetical protein